MSDAIEIASRRNARNLGQQQLPVKGGAPGYKVKRGSATGGQSSSGGREKTHGGLNQHNCRLSYRLQPKRARDV